MLSPGEWRLGVTPCLVQPVAYSRLFAQEKNDYPLDNIPPIRKLLPFWLWHLPNLRVMDESKFDGRKGNTGGWKVLPAHLSHFTQQISILVRRHKIGNVSGAQQGSSIEG